MSDTTYLIQEGTDFSSITITHNGRQHIYTGATANAIIAAMQAHTAAAIENLNKGE